MTSTPAVDRVDFEHTCHGVAMTQQADGEHKCARCGRKTKPPQRFVDEQLDPDPAWPDLQFD